MTTRDLPRGCPELSEIVRSETSTPAPAHRAPRHDRAPQLRFGSTRSSLMLSRRRRPIFVFACALLFLSLVARAAEQPITFVAETLDNGLKVIYALMHQAPVVHVRVLYNVGSRDERPDRQGFAHMFEHMMFRGSKHVPPEEHMKLIGIVGGDSHAFTSFDQTTYINTIPANHLEMALYLEADRMASFKVNEDIYKTERKVVAEEWRIRQNRPYGTQYEDFLKAQFVKHSYRW